MSTPATAPRDRQLLGGVVWNLLGRGLPLAVALAQKHGGDVRIESQPGAGTTVFLTLPPDQPSNPR